MSYRIVDSFRAGAYGPARKLEEKIVKLMRLFGFVTKKFDTMHSKIQNICWNN